MGASAMKITTVGIDLAKNVFQVHGIDERQKSTSHGSYALWSRRDNCLIFSVAVSRALRQ
jgi:transposase